MPSLRKRVSSYFRQLSFHNETREKKNINENTFVTKYLQGFITLREGPPIIYGKNPTDLPNYELGHYENGPNTVVGCYSGPNGGLTTVKRTEKHLSVLDADIDFIDTHDEEIVPTLPKKSPYKLPPGQPIDNTTMVIKVAGNEYCVTNKSKSRSKSHSKSHSLGSISDFNLEIEKTKIEKSFYLNNNSDSVECKNQIKNKVENNETDTNCDKNANNGKVCNELSSDEPKTKESNTSIKDRLRLKNETVSKYRKNLNEVDRNAQKPILRKKDINKVKSGQRNSEIIDRNTREHSLSKSKSDSNPFHHKKKGKIIKVERANTRAEDSAEVSAGPQVEINDSKLPSEWNRKSEFYYGLSDSLYDRNQVTKNKNGDPIADCFGLIARNDSAILAVADGVNWGEKASTAAKSAVHGSLHYLNKTIFNDTKPFENLTLRTEESSSSTNLNDSRSPISNTREVFVCLLRAFNCAHDLILENKGMLTTLTVAVVLPLRQRLERKLQGHEGNQRAGGEVQYVCCVCNVGDTLAYVYSQKYGVRELTKGSHDINCNRDMRDALGALGPVDGINPELSNLTLSVTTLHKGDIILVASDGLTDNFDPNVCRFTVNSTVDPSKPKPPSTSRPPKTEHPVTWENSVQIKPPPPNTENPMKPPIKPPRKYKNRDELSRSSAERSSIKSSSISERSSSQSVDNQSVAGDKSSDNVKSTNEIETVNKDRDQSGEARSSSNEPSIDYGNPLVAQFMRENSVDDSAKSEQEKVPKKPSVVENKASSLRRQASSQQYKHEPSQSSQHKPVKLQMSASSRTMFPVERKESTSRKHETATTGYKFLRSKTSVDFRTSNVKQVLRNGDGIPFVTPIQRYELQLLLIEDILRNGISGRDSPCTSSRKLCENLISFTLSITSAKRRTLEDQDLYFDNRNGVLVEVSSQEKKLRRKKGLEKVQTLPGKLDHVTVVAYNVGNFANR